MTEQSKLEKRLNGLRKLESSLRKMVLAMGNLYLADKPRQLKALTKAMARVEELRERKILGTRKMLDKCTNELVSLREGLFTGDVESTDQAQLALTTCSESLSEVTAMIASTQLRLASANTEDQEVAAAEADDEATIFTINKNKELKNGLPKLGERKFVVGRAPIVVVTSSSQVKRQGQPAAFVDRRKLEEYGFKVDNLDGYAILHNQQVIGINKRLLKPKQTAAQVADAVCQHLSVQTKKNMAFVLKSSYAYNGAVWFWIMPELELNKFAKAFPGGHVKLNEWGFAFGDTSHTPYDQQVRDRAGV